MTWKQLKKEFEKGKPDAYTVALYKELRKHLKKESQIEEIEEKIKQKQSVTPEQMEKV
jgi:hypothetical protein